MSIDEALTESWRRRGHQNDVWRLSGGICNAYRSFRRLERRRSLMDGHHEWQGRVDARRTNLAAAESGGQIYNGRDLNIIGL